MCRLLGETEAQKVLKTGSVLVLVDGRRLWNDPQMIQEKASHIWAEGHFSVSSSYVETEIRFLKLELSSSASMLKSQHHFYAKKAG